MEFEDYKQALEYAKEHSYTIVDYKKKRDNTYDVVMRDEYGRTVLESKPDRAVKLNENDIKKKRYCVIGTCKDSGILYKADTKKCDKKNDYTYKMDLARVFEYEEGKRLAEIMSQKGEKSTIWNAIEI